jgi:hypothetical protein
LRALRAFASRIDPDVRYAPLVFLVVLAAKLPSLDNPFYWDEAGAYIPPSLAVAKRGLWSALPGLHERGFLSGHPPVFYILHGALYQIFGNSVVPHHVLSVVFAAAGVWYTYRLGKLLCNPSTGVCAALLLFFSPMFFAQSSMALADVPMASLGVASAYYMFAERRVAYAVTAVLFLQTKETALAVSVAAAVYWFFVRPWDGQFWRSVAMHAVPLGSFVAFFALEYAATGSLVQASNLDSGAFLSFNPSNPSSAIGDMLVQVMWVGRVIFVGEGRFLLTATILAGLYVNARAMWRRPFAFVAIVVAFYWGAFIIVEFLPRYVMPVLPFMCIVAAWATYVVARERVVRQLAISGATALAFLPFFVYFSESGNFETNMRHERVIAVTALACAYVDEHARATIVVTDWPVSSYLRTPELGYVRSRMPKATLAQLATITSDDEIDGNFLRQYSSDLPVTFVYGPFASSRHAVVLRNNADRLGLRLLRRFEDGDLVCEIYAEERPSPGPGQE